MRSNNELIIDPFTFSLAQPDLHYPRCVVVHLASADCANYVANSVAIAGIRATKNRQRRRHPTTAAAANNQRPTTGSHQGGERERCPRKCSFKISTSFGTCEVGRARRESGVILSMTPAEEVQWGEEKMTMGGPSRFYRRMCMMR